MYNGIISVAFMEVIDSDGTSVVVDVKDFIIGGKDVVALTTVSCVFCGSYGEKGVARDFIYVFAIGFVDIS